MGGCQNDGPFLGTLNIKCRTIIGTKKGTIILTTTHMGCNVFSITFAEYQGFPQDAIGNDEATQAEMLLGHDLHAFLW